MTRRPTLDDLRTAVLLFCLDTRTWKTPTECANELGLNHGSEWVRVALTLERLSNDGRVELKKPGGTVRRFRLRPEAQA